MIANTIFNYNKLLKELKTHIRKPDKKRIAREKIEKLRLEQYDMKRRYVNVFRIISVNGYGFRCDGNQIDTRVNVRYYSKDFERLIKEANFPPKKNKYDDNKDIYNLFVKEKESLKDLSWRIDYFG